MPVRSEDLTTAQEPRVDQKLRAQLSTLSGARIFFGHQSVGRDILSGLAQVAEAAGVPLRILEVRDAPPDGPGVFHSKIGKNRDPDSKCRDFAELLTSGRNPVYDLAMMKFCYVDLKRNTPLDVGGMIDRYSRLVETIRAERPDVPLMHITLPLRATPPGRITTVQRLFGLSTSEDADNILRNAYNAALREKYNGEPMFDLAAVESTLPDGTRSAFEQHGKTFYTLDSSYTEDRGHLNEVARRWAAIAFVGSLTTALRAESGSH